MRTPAGSECRYYYEDFHRGRELAECRLIQANQASLPWRPQLCASCRVPAVLRANGSAHLRLQLTVRKRFRWLARMELRAWCTAHSCAIEDPYHGCPLCLQEMLGGGPPA